MHLTKKFDRAFQWAGERMGGEARTTHDEEFKALEGDMNVRQQGLDRMAKSTSSFVRWMSRRCDALEDKERASPMGYFSRVMNTHGEGFEPDSELGNRLVAVGQANERIAALLDTFVEQTNATWVSNLEHTQAMMKEYQTARKKLENRRLAYDASNAKMAKARRDDFRIEEEVRTSKAKFEESSEDVMRRMYDIKETEADSIAALNEFLDAELDFHERCVEELRRARQAGGAAAPVPRMSPQRTPSTRPHARSRSNTARSWQEPRDRAVYEEPEPAPVPRLASHFSPGNRAAPPLPPQSSRPQMSRSATEGRPIPRTNNPPPLPLTRVRTDGGYAPRNNQLDDCFADDVSTASGSGSPDYGERSLSPATSYGSLTHSTSNVSGRKVPPPVNRAKKPAPPVPARKENLGY